MVILFDEQFISRDRAHVDIEDRGYQFGDGVYEVIRVYGGKMFCKDQHLSRLLKSANEIGLSLPFPLERLDTLLEELVSQNRLQEGTIYLQVSRGTAPRNHPFPEKVYPRLVAYTQVVTRPLQSLQQVCARLRNRICAGFAVISSPSICWGSLSSPTKSGGSWLSGSHSAPRWPGDRR